MILKRFKNIIPGQDVKMKGTRGVRLDNRNVFCLPGPRIKHFERLFLTFNKLYMYNFTGCRSFYTLGKF